MKKKWSKSLFKNSIRVIGIDVAPKRDYSAEVHFDDQEGVTEEVQESLMEVYVDTFFTEK